MSVEQFLNIDCFYEHMFLYYHTKLVYVLLLPCSLPLFMALISAFELDMYGTFCMHDHRVLYALCVLSQIVNDSRVLLGGGWPEMVMAKEIDALDRKTRGKKSLTMEAFTRALLAIPTTIADNAGLDSAELIS
ncbi:putative T-complex protein 1, beta subunit [Medicago truncatula]|uniref:Putative T-complex protein 1, beta subunit n=1 Tax=Medicago truncatula TaxID=3880 RepID=A0A396IQC6_MEDTR|nr:putative T-complex protein 1, beta subunit [Medicago truncatula]